MLRRAAGVSAAVVLLAGCGGAKHEGAHTSRIPGVSAADPRATRVVPISKATFKRPIATYRSHVLRQLRAMHGDVERMSAAAARGDLDGARAQWLKADARYQTIGAAYGAFGDYDQAIDGLPGHLPGGTASPRFTGLHRVELALWKRRSARDAVAPSRRLARDVARLRAHVPKATIEPLDFGLRAHEVLEDSLQLELAGAASPWSGAALTALDANIAGTRVVMRGVGPIAAQTNGYAVAIANRAVDRLSRAVTGMRSRHGFPRWDSVSQRDRERIDALTSAAAEKLAYIPELVDPRPPRPALRPIESGDR